MVIDFLGDWDELAAYRFIPEELLDEEIDDIRIANLRPRSPVLSWDYLSQLRNVRGEKFIEDSAVITAGIRPNNRDVSTENSVAKPVTSIAKSSRITRELFHFLACCPVRVPRSVAPGI